VLAEERIGKMSKQRRVISTMTLALFGGLALPLTAQTNLETNAGVQFNFSTPGAGNMALGGAFLALAFDASAAYTNPAGLTTIVQPESLIEARHWTYTHVFTDRGRIAGEEITGGSHDPDNIDTIPFLRDGQAKNQVTGLSFLSYVYPKGDWSFAAYRHELVNFEADFSTFGAYLESDVRSRSPLGIPGSLKPPEPDSRPPDIEGARIVRFPVSGVPR
jgi:hypothetical protein